MTENNHVPPNAQHTLGVAFWLTGFVLLVLMPLLNVLPAEDSWLHFSDFSIDSENFWRLPFWRSDWI